MPNQGSFLSDIETLVEFQGFFCPDKNNSTQMGYFSKIENSNFTLNLFFVNFTAIITLNQSNILILLTSYFSCCRKLEHNMANSIFSKTKISPEIKIKNQKMTEWRNNLIWSFRMR